MGSPNTMKEEESNPSSDRSNATTTVSSSTSSFLNQNNDQSWIRGVNMGGWLVLERFITPYMFAITDCHLEGDFCFYPGQISAPPLTNEEERNYCNPYQCHPHFVKDVLTGNMDYPADEYTLAKSFVDHHKEKNSHNNKIAKAIATKWLTYHWEHFVTKDDVQRLKAAGITHVRVPIPHWIFGDIEEDEPWIVDGQWLYFIRFVGWCREAKLTVWADIHTAPGSQNGFDNSGQTKSDQPSCEGWYSSSSSSDNRKNMQRSLQVVEDLVAAIVRDNVQDVVTGIGFLNEPYGCDELILQDLYTQALEVVRTKLPTSTAVFIGDSFNATKWNTGWWTDPDLYSNTFLDSHSYQVFAEKARALSPKQHVAYTCQHDARQIEECCYEDHPKNEKPSKGISRIVGEWSAALDILPVSKQRAIMKGIAKNSEAPELHRKLSDERKSALKSFVQAQMVTFESAHRGISRGWFYWNFKMEGGAFAEWDFLRGVKEGWIPSLPHSTVSAESVYGSCYEIVDRTIDSKNVVDEFPDPRKTQGLWIGPNIDDDFVISHGKGGTPSNHPVNGPAGKSSNDEKGHVGLFPLFVIGFFCYAIWRVFFKNAHGSAGTAIHIPSVPNPLLPARNRGQYTDLDAPTQLNV